jgi:hypothetical protein
MRGDARDGPRTAVATPVCVGSAASPVAGAIRACVSISAMRRRSSSIWSWVGACSSPAIVS